MSDVADYEPKNIFLTGGAGTCSFCVLMVWLDMRND